MDAADARAAAGQGRLQPPLPSRRSPAPPPRSTRARTASSCTSRRATGTAAGPATTASGAPSRSARAAASWSTRACTCSTSTHWLAGPLPLHSALLRTQFWDGRGRGQRGADPRAAPTTATAPWAMLHVDLDRVEEHVLTRDLLPHRQAPGRRPRALVRAAAAAHLPDEARARAAGARGDRVPRRGRLVERRVGALRAAC